MENVAYGVAYGFIACPTRCVVVVAILTSTAKLATSDTRGRDGTQEMYPLLGFYNLPDNSRGGNRHRIIRRCRSQTEGCYKRPIHTTTPGSGPRTRAVPSRRAESISVPSYRILFNGKKEGVRRRVKERERNVGIKNKFVRWAGNRNSLSPDNCELPVIDVFHFMAGYSATRITNLNSNLWYKAIFQEIFDKANGMA